MLDFQKYVRYLKFAAYHFLNGSEFYTPVCYCGDISMPRNMTQNEINRDWSFDMYNII